MPYKDRKPNPNCDYIIRDKAHDCHFFRWRTVGGKFITKYHKSVEVLEECRERAFDCLAASYSPQETQFEVDIIAAKHVGNNIKQLSPKSFTVSYRNKKYYVRRLETASVLIEKLFRSFNTYKSVKQFDDIFRKTKITYDYRDVVTEETHHE